MAAIDQFIGEELSHAENDPAQALFHVLQCGLEKSVSYGAGTRHGPKAIIEASHQLERIIDGMEPASAGIVTYAEIDCDRPVEQVMDSLAAQSCEIVQKGGIPVTLGGEHALSYGAVKGVIQALGKDPVGIVQIDAHADLRQAYQGNPYSHASVMHLLCSHGVRLAQIGVRAFCQEEVDARQKFEVICFDGAQLSRSKHTEIILPDNFPEQIYISFDLDGLDPSILPATGTPVPGGLEYYQAMDLLASATKGRKIVGCDIVELAPSSAHPASNFIAASVAYHLMGLALPTG